MEVVCHTGYTSSSTLGWMNNSPDLHVQIALNCPQELRPSEPTGPSHPNQPLIVHAHKAFPRFNTDLDIGHAHAHMPIMINCPVNFPFLTLNLPYIYQVQHIIKYLNIVHPLLLYIPSSTVVWLNNILRSTHLNLLSKAAFSLISAPSTSSKYQKGLILQGTKA